MKLAFVTPRYGADVSSGAEHACRLLAEHVSARHQVDVLTTCARDPQTWHNEFSEGTDRVRGVVVRRYAVNQAHDPDAFRRLSQDMAGMPHGRDDEREWVRQLGPNAPGLIDHLKRNQRSYDAVIFFSLYHATTVFGIAAAPERSILFPYVQVDPVLRYGIWNDVFGAARAVGYLSSSERTVVRSYARAVVAEEFVGVGIDVPAQQSYPRHQQDPLDEPESEEGQASPADAAGAGEPPSYLSGRGVLFKRRHRLYGPFALYGGRLQPDNGTEEMLEYFDAYSAGNGGMPLVLMGVKLMTVPEPRNVHLAGLLPDRERMIAFEAAEVTLAPESNDLTGTTVLESFAVGTPVLASARNPAAVDHCRRGNGGLFYATRDEFIEGMRLLMGDPRLRQRLGESGRRYVQQHYRWDAVMGRFERLVGRLRQS
jgi:glycosyltransferase involved in cell wall biosynthesis